MQGMIVRRIAALAIIAFAIVLSLLALFAFASEGPETGDPALRLFYNDLFFHVPLALLVFALALLRGNTRQWLGLGAGQTIARTAPAAAIGFLTFSMSADIAGEWSGVSMKALEEIEKWLRDAWISNPALTFLSISIIPGFVEELALRGYLLNRLRGRLGTAAALTLSSLLFGVLHLDPLHSTMAFFMGLYLGALALLTGGIWVPVIAHAFNNFMALLAVAWGWDDFDEIGVAGEVGVFTATALISAACLVYCARTVREVRAERAADAGFAARGMAAPGTTGPGGMGPGQAPPGTHTGASTMNAHYEGRSGLPMSEEEAKRKKRAELIYNIIKAQGYRPSKKPVQRNSRDIP